MAARRARSIEAAGGGRRSPARTTVATTLAPREATAPPVGRQRLLGWLIVAVLVGGCYALYFPTFWYGFVDFDDREYVVENTQVLKGLTPETIRWAFTTTDSVNWLPMTWLSLMLDTTTFGTGGGGFHLTNVTLHAVASALTYVVLHRLTGARWRSAAVASLFAFHPLRVESVAWVSERKDVLSAAFGMLTLLAWVAYVRRPAVWRYLLILLAYALGLMSKTMLVTLPAVMLFLDYWPLRRLEPGRRTRERRFSGSPWRRRRCSAWRSSPACGRLSSRRAAAR